MIKLKKPIYTQENIIDDCISNMRDTKNSTKSRVVSSKNEIVSKSKEYDELAQKGQLGRLKEHENIKGGATKRDMQKLYDQKFARKEQGGRKYYDAIKLLAPYGRCPLCGQREVKTLDHYLPKSKFPLYAVTPYNLIPACSDCNKDKFNDISICREKETIHPYYDDFTDEVWIKAKMIEEDPITFEFYVKKPKNWDDLKYKRACYHFEKFGLNKLYKPYACEMFTGCLPRLRRLLKKSGRIAVEEHIKECIDEAREVRLNTWQAAVYESILECEWFWNEYL